MNKFLNLLVCFSLICTTVSAAGRNGLPEGGASVPDGLSLVQAEKLFSLPAGSPFVLSAWSPFVGTMDSSSPFLFQDEFFTGGEARARAAVMKRTGTALLISGGVLSTTGVALYGAAIASLDHDLGTAGLAVTGASLPFYIAGAILRSKGKKGMLEVAPGTLCLRF